MQQLLFGYILQFHISFLLGFFFQKGEDKLSSSFIPHLFPHLHLLPHHQILSITEINCIPLNSLMNFIFGSS